MRCLHFDIMDGHFVPNITFGPMVVKAVRPITKAEFDVHLMIENAERYIDTFVEAGANAITVHPEACVHLHRVIQQIKHAGAKAGVALNPATPLSAIEYVLSDIDIILVMTVNPGFGGQKFIETMIPKITAARRMVDELGQGYRHSCGWRNRPFHLRKRCQSRRNMLIAGNAVFASPDGAANAVRNLEDLAIKSVR